MQNEGKFIIKGMVYLPQRRHQRACWRVLFYALLIHSNLLFIKKDNASAASSFFHHNGPLAGDTEYVRHSQSSAHFLLPEKLTLMAFSFGAKKGLNEHVKYERQLRKDKNTHKRFLLLLYFMVPQLVLPPETIIYRKV